MACEDCIDTVCAEALTRHEEGSAEVEEFEACRENYSWNYCCNNYWEGCFLTVLLYDCTCGHPNQSCTNSCSDACDGGGMDYDCWDCILRSPCGVHLYDYFFASDYDGYWDCHTDCGGDPGCEADCCDNHPEACAARAATIDCTCD